MRVWMQGLLHRGGMCGLFVLICSTVGMPQTAPVSKAASAPKATPSSQPKPAISADAQAAAGRLWDAVVKKCGAKTYALPLYAHGGSLHEGNSVSELDKPSFKVEPETIARAEELNGVQWKGLAILSAAAVLGSDGRWYEPSGELSRRRNNEVRAFGMVKIKGAWRYMTLYGGSIVYDTGDWDLDIAMSKDKAPSCAEIPGTPDFAVAQRNAEDAQRKAEQAAAAEEVKAQAAREQQRQQHLKDLQAAAVRSYQPQTDLEKQTQSDGFWTDPKTGLTWTAKGRFTSAFRACKDLGSESDWRVADINEMQSIYDPSKSHEYIYGSTIGQYHIAGGIMLSDAVVWTTIVGLPARSADGSAATSPDGPETNYNQKVWVLDFSSGQRRQQTVSNSGTLLCVRGALHSNAK
jgi:uncharacterized protein DUF1566